MLFKNVPKLLTLLFATVILLSACKKEGTTSTNDSPFKSTDFKISNIRLDDDSQGGFVFIDFDETNTTSINYKSEIHGGFKIKMTIKTTDGSTYQNNQYLALDLDAKAVSAEEMYIDYTKGKTIVPASLKFEVYKEQ